MVPFLRNWLKWVVTYRIQWILGLVSFEWSYDEFIPIDIVWLGCWLMSWPVGLWNPLRIVDAAININWMYCPNTVASAMCYCWFETISPLYISRRIAAWLSSGINTKLTFRVNFNWIHFPTNWSAPMSAPKFVCYLMDIMSGLKGIIHTMSYVKRIWNCESYNSVKVYASVWPHSNLHQ